MEQHYNFHITDYYGFLLNLFTTLLQDTVKEFKFFIELYEHSGIIVIVFVTITIHFKTVISGLYEGMPL